MKLSVIVCVYNTKREYLSECLASVVRGTLSDIEICIVDDGSTLDYTDIIEKYGARYIKTENRGILSARLTGIGMASGEYLAFLDSDDTVSFDFYRPMTELAESENADIVTNDWAFRTDKARYFCKQDFTISGDIYANGAEVLEVFLSKSGKQHSAFVLWNKIYRRDVLIYAAEQISALGLNRRYMYSEDALISFFAHKAASLMRSVHTGYYFYRVHSAQSVNAVSEEKLRSQITDMTETLAVMRGACESSRSFTEKIDEWAALMARSHYSHAYSQGYTSLYPYIKERYGVEELRRSLYSDGAVYVNNELLPENFSEIDEALAALYSLPVPSEVYCDKNNKYAYRTLVRLIEEGREITLADGAGIRIPEPKISLRNRIIHNGTVYSLGMLLFPKGSKIRAYLKKRF